MGEPMRIASCGLDFFKERLEIVLYRAVPVTFPADPFTGKAAGTALVIQVIEVDEFGLGTLRLGAIHGRPEKRCGVPLLPWAAIKCY